MEVLSFQRLQQRRHSQHYHRQRNNANNQFSSSSSSSSFFSSNNFSAFGRRKKRENLRKNEFCGVCRSDGDAVVNEVLPSSSSSSSSSSSFFVYSLSSPPPRFSFVFLFFFIFFLFAALSNFASGGKLPGEKKKQEEQSRKGVSEAGTIDKPSPSGSAIKELSWKTDHQELDNKTTDHDVQLTTYKAYRQQDLEEDSPPRRDLKESDHEGFNHVSSWLDGFGEGVEDNWGDAFPKVFDEIETITMMKIRNPKGITKEDDKKFILGGTLMLLTFDENLSSRSDPQKLQSLEILAKYAFPFPYAQPVISTKYITEVGEVASVFNSFPLKLRMSFFGNDPTFLINLYGSAPKTGENDASHDDPNKTVLEPLETVIKCFKTVQEAVPIFLKYNRPELVQMEPQVISAIKRHLLLAFSKVDVKTVKRNLGNFIDNAILYFSKNVTELFQSGVIRSLSGDPLNRNEANSNSGWRARTRETRRRL